MPGAEKGDVDSRLAFPACLEGDVPGEKPLAWSREELEFERGEPIGARPLAGRESLMRKGWEGVLVGSGLGESREG